MAVYVLCCGCKGLLQNDNSIVYWDPRISYPEATVFGTAEQADKGARNAGWECEAGGIKGNHRCPDCANYEATEPAPPPSRNVGAFIDAALICGREIK